jgi:type III pantothenate kinase
MSPDVVVDVGNTRIKWGRCLNGRVAYSVSLPPDEPGVWQEQFDRWGLTDAVWAIASVHPNRTAALVNWLNERRSYVWVLESYQQLPLKVRLNHPEKVGIDRLLNAVAVTRHWARSRLPAVVVDAGSAVTVDWVDESGAFRGGSIAPGLGLMARALHQHTALLPLVEVSTPRPYLPGLSTAQAIEAGVYYMACGGINLLITLLVAGSAQPPHIFLTGGDAPLLEYAVDDRAEHWPEMTLEGIRHSAEAQP